MLLNRWQSAATRGRLPACQGKHLRMTSRSIRRLRLRSTLQPRGAGASEGLKVTHLRWSHLVRVYRSWESQPAESRPRCPVHLPWVQSFDLFFQDMGPCPSKELSLVRKDPSLPYRPGNCTWDTYVHGGRPPQLLASHQGETLPIRDWCQRLGLSRQTVYARIRRGQSPEVALGLTQECA
jgi:hypothetical protein